MSPLKGSGSVCPDFSPPHSFGDEMKIVVYVVSLLLLTFATQPLVHAQGPMDARITVAHPGFSLMKSDMKSVLDLTTPVEQKQWENIEGYIDTFIIGVDQTREFQLQVMTGLNPAGYLLCAPLDETGDDPSKSLRENLDSLGYRIMRNPADRTLYTIESDADEFGWMRVDAGARYAYFLITTDKTLLPQIKEIVIKAALTPTKLNDNMIAELKNTEIAAGAVAHRVSAFKPIRAEYLGKIKQRPDESPSTFNLRHASARQLYDEAEIIMSQADQLLVTMSLDRAVNGAPKLKIRTTATGIVGTAMATTIAQYKEHADAYAGLQRLKGSALSVRVNHPLDELRKTHLMELLTLSKTDIDARLAGNKDRTAAEKEAFGKLTTGIIGVLQSSINTGHLNGFVESIPDGEDNFTTVAAYLSPTATALNDVLPFLAEAGKGNEVQMSVEKVGEIEIHRIKIAEGVIEVFDKVFGTNKTLYVGIGPQQVWMASGKNGLATLKSIISSIGAPAPSAVALKIEGNLLPWAKRLDVIAKKEKPGKLTPEEEKTHRENARRRERALAALVSEDDFSFVVSGQNEMWVGEFSSNTGLLRFAGKMMSAFSKENFE